MITTAVCPSAGAVMGAMTVAMDLTKETVVSNTLVNRYHQHVFSMYSGVWSSVLCMYLQNPDLALRVSIVVTTSSAFQELGFVTMTMTVGTILMRGTVVS